MESIRARARRRLWLCTRFSVRVWVEDCLVHVEELGFVTLIDRNGSG